ncbi:multicopper oxidase family protein [Trinickia mobilis]|uniref:multicopper oxidase family protein n=1 Tax=Trinickia mobilis TaxID=2816356 RepID=UPI001A8BF817|nr:multicopper oxidase domain-containing protein [Trinickia mobilis]
MLLTRRKFLLTSLAASSAALTARAQSPVNAFKSGANSARSGDAARAPHRLVTETRSIEVNGRAATMLGVRQPDGTRGLFLDPGEPFAVELHNQLDKPTIVHWHGQTPPPDQDGVSHFGIPELQPGERRAYDFVARPGSYWMHSHHGLQEQQLLAAPLIVRTADDVRADNQEVTLFLQDFLFRDPAEVMSDFRRPEMKAMAGSGHVRQSSGVSGMPGMGTMAMNRMAGGDVQDMAEQMPAMTMDLNDVDFDAYLANDRTLADPEIVRVERSGKVRLRIINGASSTNFHIDLGQLQGTVAAVDGNPTQPLGGSRFELAMAQRMDILVDLPNEAGVWPILAVREGDRKQTGVVLATRGINVPKFDSLATEKSHAVAFDQELRLSAAHPLASRPVDAHFMLMLTGSMQPYVWGFNGKGWDQRDTVAIRSNQRVALTFHNMTMMSHPIHLHGHHFQVVALNGKAFPGALRDTVMVPPAAKVTVAFDANNAGRWLMHCHNLYHMEAGMITEVAYV